MDKLFYFKRKVQLVQHYLLLLLYHWVRPSQPQNLRNSLNEKQVSASVLGHDLQILGSHSNLREDPSSPWWLHKNYLYISPLPP